MWAERVCTVMRSLFQTTRFFKSLIIRIREGLLIKVIFTSSSERLLLSNRKPSLEFKNAQIGKAIETNLVKDSILQLRKTKAWRCWINYSKSASENDRGEPRLEAPDSPSNELYCLFQCCFKCSKNKVAQTGDSSCTGLRKGLGIPNFNKSSRWFLRSSKFGNHYFTSHELLNLR